MNTTDESKPDYYAVYSRPGATAAPTFVSNVLAMDKGDAMRITRNHGHKLPRGSYAVHIGRQGYFLALSRVFATA